MIRAGRIAAAVLFVVAGVFGLYEVVDAPQSGFFGPVLTQGTGRRLVAITFDDGPNPQRTPALLGLLEAERVHATFFVVGRAARAHPDLMRRMVRDGDEIENHTQTHAHLNWLTRGQIRRQIVSTDEAIAAVTHRPTAFVRPPFGARNAATFAVARTLGKRVVLWSAMLPDARLSGPHDRAIARWLSGAGRSPIIVLHDGDQGRDGTGGRTAEARDDTRAVIRYFRTRGYRFVTVADLAGAAV